MPTEDFFYANLISRSYRVDAPLNVNSSMSIENGKFFSLNYNERPENFGATRGWKFALSIDDTDKTEQVGDFNVSPNLSLGWDIAIEILLEAGIRVVKVIHPADTPMSNLLGERNFSKDNKNPQTIQGLEAGKQITVYASRHPDVEPYQWQTIFQAITNRFLEEGIRPSCPSYGSRRLGNNPYITYRNDSTPSGKYQGVTQNYNPHDFPDPYSDMHFGNIPDIDIPAWPFEEVLTSEEEKVGNIQPILQAGNQLEVQEVLVQEIMDNDGEEETQEESYHEDNTLSDQETSDKELPMVDSSLSKKTYKAPSAMLSAASQGTLEEEISDHEETVEVGMIENQEENGDNKENQSNCCKCRLL